jgi:hypothetical protein
VTIPAGALAVVGNGTVVNFLSGPGFITLFPDGADQPTASNLNYLSNQVVPNACTGGLGGSGAFKIFASTTTHFIADITGYYSADAGVDVNGVAGLLYNPLPRPIRLLDTRQNSPACDMPGTPLTGGQSRTELARVTCGGVTIPATAQAVVGNGTVVNFLSGAGFVTLYPSGAMRPTVSNLNYLSNQIIPNAFTVGLGANGAFEIYPSTTTDFIVDLTGYFAP